MRGTREVSPALGVQPPPCEKCSSAQPSTGSTLLPALPPPTVHIGWISNMYVSLKTAASVWPPTSAAPGGTGEARSQVAVLAPM